MAEVRNLDKEAFDWSKWGPIFISGSALAISVLSLVWNVLVERKRSRANVEVWLRPTFYTGGEDNRTEIELIFRNLSHRPTAIVDIYVRNKEGGILGGTGYNNNIKLPLQLEPWGVIKASFRIERIDETLMANILVKDIEDNEIIIVPDPGKKWVKVK
jgi:hypothetical protein